MKRSAGDFPSSKQEQFFTELSNARYKGIPGVTMVQGNTRSNSFAVMMAMTHGCEPGGLAAAHALLHDADVRKNLQGNVAVVVNNIVAARRFFDEKDPTKLSSHRFYQLDGNRVPEDILERTPGDKQPYEVNRMLQLLPLLQDASMGLDVHSLGQAGDPSIITTKGHLKDLDMLNASIDVQDRIDNIVAHMTGLSINCLIGGLKQGGNKMDRLNQDVPALALEVGPHLESKTMDFARQIVLSALMAAGYLDGQHAERTVQKRQYTTIGNIKFRDLSDKFARTHAGFGFIKEGELLYTGNQGDVFAEQDCHTIFGISEAGRSITDPKFLSGERMFLSAPVQIRDVTLREPQFED